jgi:hypothetical protein
MNNKNEANSDTASDDMRMFVGDCLQEVCVSHLESFQMDDKLMRIHPNMKFLKVTVKQDPELNTSTQRAGYAFRSQYF